MNAPCTLHALRIRVISERCPILLRLPGTNDPIVAIRASDMPERGHLNGIPAEGGWILINHPRPGVGLVGLPLNGQTGSWCAAWEYELAAFDFCLSGEWVEIDDWSMLAPLGAAP